MSEFIKFTNIIIIIVMLLAALVLVLHAFSANDQDGWGFSLAGIPLYISMLNVSILILTPLALVFIIGLGFIRERRIKLGVASFGLIIILAISCVAGLLIK